MRLFSLLAAAFLWGTTVGAESLKSEKSAQTIKWVLAHEPVDLFKEAAEYFSSEMRKKTGGQVIVEVMTLAEYENKYNGGKKIEQSAVVNFIRNGKIEMSQTYTTDLGVYNNDMYVLDMPFLFRDHTHAEKVLEGPLGDRLLAGLEDSNIRGLAFTYSGGYRIVPSSKAIKTVEDFKGLKIRTSGSPVAQDTFKALGAEPVPMALDKIELASKEKRIDGAESTYPRFYSMGQNKHSEFLNDTQHSLFLTSIIINNGVWQKLSTEQQKIFKETAIQAARLERKQSIRDSVETKKNCTKEGIPVVDLSREEQEKFKKLMVPLYKKYKNVFGNEIIAQIQRVK